MLRWSRGDQVSLDETAGSFMCGNKLCLVYNGLFGLSRCYKDHVLSSFFNRDSHGRSLVLQETAWNGRSNFTSKRKNDMG